MNSIDKEQKEENFKNLAGSEAVEKIRTLAKKAGSCMLCTDISTGKSFSTRPMAVQEIDDDGNFWFLTAADSHKNEELQKDAAMQLIFQGSSYSDFMSLYGKGTISRDRAKIEELWEGTMKNWFTEGIDDPRITVLKFAPTQGHYWDTKHGQAVAMIKTVIGAISGETSDDSIQGNIHP